MHGRYHLVTILGRIMWATDSLQDAYLESTLAASIISDPLLVRDTLTGRAVYLSNRGTVTTTHTHGGPYTYSNCTILNCGE